MRKIKDDDGGVRELNINDLIHEFEDDVMNLDRDDIDDSEWQLAQNQYAYVKFGLILEKIRTRAWWIKCSEKFSDFRAFCESKVNLNIWQVNNAIKSARVAVQLTWLGFTQLPRNASQALKLAELSIERMAEVWENVIKSCQGHKITALAIEQQIDPDKQSINTTLRLPRKVVDALTAQAIAAGMTLNEYLAELADPLGSEEGRAIDPDVTVSIDQVQVLDALDLKFQLIVTEPKPKKVFREVIESFDLLMQDLIGQFTSHYT